MGPEARGDALVEEGTDENGKVGGFAEEVSVEVKGRCGVGEGWWAGHGRARGSSCRCCAWFQRVGCREEVIF